MAASITAQVSDIAALASSTLMTAERHQERNNAERNAALAS